MESLPPLLRPPDVDPASLIALQAQGGTLLCLGLPKASQFGLDYAEWSVGPRFLGISVVPPGPHFLWYSAAGKLGDLAPRTGMFFTISPGDVYVTMWDPRTEVLLQPEQLAPEELERITEAARRHEFSAGLGLYPLKSLPIWTSLSCHCRPPVLARVCLSSTVASTAHRLEAAGVSEQSDAPVGESKEEVAREAGVLKFEEPPEAGVLQFAWSEVRGCGRAAAPADVTQFAMDTSPALHHLLLGTLGGDAGQFLGELQLAFIAFVHGQELGGFEQWKALVVALCRCEGLLMQQFGGGPPAVPPSLFVEAYATLEAQLKVMPKDTFFDELSKQHFLGDCFRSLHHTLDACVRQSDVGDAAARVLSTAKSVFGWTPPDELEGGEDEEEEDGPTVVDLEATMF